MNSPISPELQMYRPEVFKAPNGEMLAVRFDVQSLLESKIGPDWQEQMCTAIETQGKPVERGFKHWTIREADPNGKIELITFDGSEMADLIPGLWELYQGTFKQMMESVLPPNVPRLKIYDDRNRGLECVSQKPATIDEKYPRRMEAHVDQRYTAVLSLAAPNSEKEGRLVIGNNPDAKNVEEIAADAVYIVHKPGTVVCFSRGSQYPHYTEEITDPDSRRIIVSLNYPTEHETEDEARELTEHILGKANQ